MRERVRVRAEQALRVMRMDIQRPLAFHGGLRLADGVAALRDGEAVEDGHRGRCAEHRAAAAEVEVGACRGCAGCPATAAAEGEVGVRGAGGGEG